MQGLRAVATATAPKLSLFKPAALVVHGNQYLDSLRTQSKNDYAVQNLERLNVNVKNEGNTGAKSINAKEWLQDLHKHNGTNFISLSRTSSPLAEQKKTDKSSHEDDFVLVSSNKDDLHKAWNITNKNQTESSEPIAISSNTTGVKNLNDYLLWRKIALGDVRERFKNSLERMRDFAILHHNEMDQVPKALTTSFLNQLEMAEKFIHMDVMLSTKKELDQLFRFLNLPPEYVLTSQARVALQILNATTCMMNNEPIKKPFSKNDKLNQEFSTLSDEMNQSLIDSMVCSCNYLEKDF
ncbi:hypothetical protein DFA_02628 [Cavenderia fasciculata]|uniref:Uncharacterized protein n=1 Tax=Cavenderia fasciculata TaxID=261658 RepID=F4PZX5_CACFS|nr:uncharacterized protein DFA_02628 [Cavenderia fasciculata]EGG18889.1 hypothetical protein DFA_02628 [Cavenderia fasciculata]|eukprot:XP_004357351.1 hypothetical protein DFA_02628 [Cavenderia fasciculata]